MISIIREGAFRRGFSGDIEEIKSEYASYDLQEHLYIHTNREGVYDMLPQGIFHHPSYSKKADKDKDEALDEIKIRREEEFFARRFFHPFETVSDEILIQARLYELRFHKRLGRSDFIDLFIPYWPILKLLERKQANYFMYILPILYHVRNRKEETEEALSFILDAPVQITTIKLPAKQADRYFESFVGKNEMGIDFVLGNSFDDGEYDLKLTVGPISARKMIDFIETGKGYRLLELLCDLFLPVGAFVVKEFKILPEDSAFILSDEQHTTFLGVNSFI